MFVKAELWTVGKTETGMAALMRIAGSARCIPVYVEPSEAQILLAALSGISQDPPGWTEMMAAFGVAVSVNPESIEILRSGIQGQYRAVVHFTGDSTRFSLNTRTPDALALALRTGVPIFLEEAIPEEDSITISMAETEPPFTTQLKRLRSDLKRRVAAEDYEQAARIRDRILQIEERMRSAAE